MLIDIVLIEGTSRMRAVIDIGATAKQHADFAGQLLAAHALRGVTRSLSCGESKSS